MPFHVLLVALAFTGASSYRVRQNIEGAAQSISQNEGEQVKDSLVIDSVIDFTSLMKGQKQIYMASTGKSYRCCSYAAGQVSALVHVEGTDLKWWGDIHRSLGRQTGCTQLIGTGYHSWTFWPGNKCLVLESGLPSEFRTPQILANKVDMLLDVTYALMLGKEKQVKLQSGNEYRCCTKSIGETALIVNAAQEEKLSAPIFSGCRALMGWGYHSWNHWGEGRCLVTAGKLSADVKRVLSAKDGNDDAPTEDPTEDNGGVRPGGNTGGITDNTGEHNGGHNGGHTGGNPITPVVPIDNGGDSDNEEEPVATTTEKPEPTGPLPNFVVRVVKATTGMIEPGVTVKISEFDEYDELGDVIGESVSTEGGYANFILPTTVKRVAVSHGSEGFATYYREYDLEDRKGRRKKQKLVQIALNPRS